MEKLNNTPPLGIPMKITNDEGKMVGVDLVERVFGVSSVFFNNLDKDMDEQELYNVVYQIGPLASIKVNFCS